MINTNPPRWQQEPMPGLANPIVSFADLQFKPVEPEIKRRSPFYRRPTNGQNTVRW